MIVPVFTFGKRRSYFVSLWSKLKLQTPKVYVSTTICLPQTDQVRPRFVVLVVYKSACFFLRTELFKVASWRTEVPNGQNSPQIIISCDFTRFFRQISADLHNFRFRRLYPFKTVSGICKYDGSTCQFLEFFTLNFARFWSFGPTVCPLSFQRKKASPSVNNNNKKSLKKSNL